MTKVDIPTEAGVDGVGTVERFIFIDATKLTLASRLKLAMSIALTPITLVFLGRSIAVHPKDSDV